MRSRTTKVIISLIMMGICSIAFSKIYQWKDASGVTHFSDKAPKKNQKKENIKELKLAPVQSYSTSEKEEKNSEQAMPSSEPEQPSYRQTLYDKVALLSPKSQETIWSNEGIVQVAVEVSPKLESNDKLDILVDGKSLGMFSATSMSLHGVERGAHTIQVNVLNEQGRIVKSSRSVTFFMKQHRIKKTSEAKQTTLVT